MRLISEIAIIPESSTIALFGIGLASLRAFRRARELTRRPDPPFILQHPEDLGE